MTTPPRSRQKLRSVVARLRKAYGPVERDEEDDAVGVLVRTILSQNTSRANSSAGYERLARRLATWDQVADAPVRLIASCIRPSGLANTKAPRIRAILRRIRRERGRIELDFLGQMPRDEAYRYLLEMDGIGPKTASCVLLFAFGEDVFPVDTHIHRMAIRLGVLGEDASAAMAHEVLTPLIAPADRYDMHVLLIAHGRRVCLARRPRCEHCCLLALCPHGREVLEGRMVG
jgi:endonuclease-3